MRFTEEGFQVLLARTRGVAATVGGAGFAEPSTLSAAEAHDPGHSLPAQKPKRKSRAPERTLAPKITEDDLQVSCFEWINLMLPQYPVLEWIIHVPNGGKRPLGVAGKLKAMGVKKGVLDILLPMPYNGWSGFVSELKVGRNTMTPEQEEWMTAFEAAGYFTCLCYTLDEFIRRISAFLKGAPGPLGRSEYQEAATMGALFAQRSAAWSKGRTS